MRRFSRFLARWRLWLAVKSFGMGLVPAQHRSWMAREQKYFQDWVRKEFNRASWRTKVLRNAYLQPFQDLLNRPSGGEAYCGGAVFEDPDRQPTLRHFRGRVPIDKPLLKIVDEHALTMQRCSSRLFWCGPLAFHFGHQIADFGSRLLLSSLDPRSGELLWYPWNSAHNFDDLLLWQRFLLTYLNPGRKSHVIATHSLQVNQLVVVPQQARMRAVPTLSHLEALSWCEKSLKPLFQGVVYVSRSRFAPCTSAQTLKGGYAAEALFERKLQERGVNIIYPESLSLEDQLQIYLGAEVLIIAEGSAQHGLELLGYHHCKSVVVICRRAQLPGMELPLQSRFPRVIFVHAVQQHWQAAEGVSWNGLALLHWQLVAEAINPLLSSPLNLQDCFHLQEAGLQQLKELEAVMPLKSVASIS